MEMHKYVWSLIFVLALVVPGLAKDKVVVESKWTAAPVQIDGNGADWAQDVLIVNKDYNLSYAFKNDADFLYLLFVFNIKEGQRENKYMSSIDFTGLTLWANPEGKEKKTHGLHFYRKRVTADQLILELQKRGQTITPEQIKEIQSKSGYSLLTCDVVNKKGETVPSQGMGTATFQTKKIQPGIVFEYQIPIALLEDPASAVKWDRSQPLKLGFEWGGSTPEMLKNQGAMLGDQGTKTGTRETDLASQVSSGYEGGGGSGNRDFDAADRRRALPKKYDFWIDLKVAQAGK